MSRKKGVGDGDSAAQKRAHGALPDTVHATKKSSTPVASGTTTEKGAADSVEFIFEAHRWVNTMDSEGDCDHASTGICYHGKIVEGITCERS